MKHKRNLVLGAVAGSASLLLTAVICPLALADNQNSIGVKIATRLSITNSKPTVNINYSSTQNSLHTEFTSINVSTNNKTGYTLTMSDQDENTDLANIKPGSTAKIPSVNTAINTTPPEHSNFPSVGWGFSTNASTTDPLNNPIDFSPIPKLSTPSNIRQTSGPTNNDQTNVTFGVKVNNGIASGTYRDTVTFSAVTNYVGDTIFDISTMQEMTPAICSNTTRPTKEATETISYHSTDTSKVPETTLTDTRDGKNYVVRKLADDNCWMSQNLALSPNGSTTYTEADTDLHDGRTFQPPAASPEGTNANHDGTSGPMYLKPKVGYEYYTNGTTPSSTGNPVNASGNYYNWPMATAGARDTNGVDLLTQNNNNGEAADSICPKGWRLPPNLNGSQSYKHLIDDYGIDRRSDSQILATPFNFVRTGEYEVLDIAGNAYFFEQGITGVLYSSNLKFGGAQTLRFSANALIGEYRIFYYLNSPPGWPYPVRCVAR